MAVSPVNVPAATAAAAASAPQPLFPRPSSPVKPELKPNPHPYAIKTTSTGVLSRSNSSPHNPSPAQYHYVPSSPGSPGRSPSHRHGPPSLHGHRYSKSLSSDSPSPLPIPPSFTFPSLAKEKAIEDDSTPRRLRRADTLPSSVPALDSIPRMTSDDLPSNPKEWTPSQLASYLTTALRVKSGEALSLPLPVARDIAQFVREIGITGRGFLRLSNAELEEMGVNSLWRTALLTASRNLRQNVLRGRIWGFGSSSNAEPSNSNPDSIEPSGSTYHRYISHARGGHRKGRVRGLVENFERSGNASEGSGGGHARRRSGSVSSQGSYWSTDEHEPLDSPDRAGHGHYVDHDIQPDPDSEPTVEALIQTMPEPNKGSWGAQAWEEDVGIWDTVKRAASAEERGDRDHDCLDIRALNGRDGAGTDQHEVDSIPDFDAEFAAEFAKSRNKKGEIDVGNGGWGADAAGRLHGAGGTRGKKERRVVTAIFAGEPAYEKGQRDQSCQTDGEDTVQDISPEQEARLQFEMDETRALIHSFKQRLEDVERKIEDMEQRERLGEEERQASAARREEEERRENELQQARERERARMRDEEVQRRRMEDSRLSLGVLILRPHVPLSRMLRLVSLLGSANTQPVSTVQHPERCYSFDVQYPLMVVGTAERHIQIFNLSNPTSAYKTIQSPLKWQTRVVSCFTASNNNGFAVGSIEGKVAIQYVDEKDSNDNFSFKCHGRDSSPNNKDQALVFAVNDILFHPVHGTFSTYGQCLAAFQLARASQGPTASSTFGTKMHAIEKAVGPITSTTFNRNGSIFAYSISYDWHKCHTGMTPGHPNKVMLHACKDEEMKKRSRK